MSRASLAPSAAADALAGFAIANSGSTDAWAFSTLASAMVCSVALFLFGMSLNDIADRRKDARGRPERPLPSAAITLRTALVFAGACALVALAVGFGLGGFVVRALVASLIVTILAYNLLPGHAGAAGPILLGLIRGQNLCLGAAIGGAVDRALLVGLVYALYIAAVSFAARMEDGEVPYHRRGLRARIRVAQCAALLAPIAVSRSVALIPIVVAAYLVFRIERAMALATSVDPPPKPALPRLIGACLGGIVLLDASLVLAAGWRVAGAILLVFFPLGRRLVMRFPPS